MKWISYSLLIATVSLLLSCSNGQKPKNKQSYLDYVPADTIFYFGTAGSEKLANFSYPGGVSGLDWARIEAPWLAYLEKSGNKQGKAFQFFKYIADQMIAANDGSEKAARAVLGMSDAKPLAIYTDGIVPVFRTQLSDATVFEALIANAVEQSQWQFSESILGDARLRKWKLQFDDMIIDFALLTRNNDVIFSFITPWDSDQDLASRFAIKKPARSLTDSGEYETIRLTQKFNHVGGGFINLERLVAGLVSKESNTLAQHLSKLELFDAEKIPLECKQDALSIVQNAPRIFMGYRHLDTTQSQLVFDFSIGLEINNEPLLKEIRALQGVLAEHSLTSDDKFLSLSLGVDLASLSENVSTLLNRFVGAPYRCQGLKKIQQAATEANLQGLNLISAMGDGIKGLGFSLYDIQWLESEPAPRSIDALMTIPSENPQKTAQLASLIPITRGVNIPADGTSVDIANPLDFDLKAAIKKSGVVVYSGDQSREVANSKSRSKKPKVGVLAMSFDYRRLMHILPRLYQGAQEPEDHKPNKCIDEMVSLQENTKHLFDAVFVLKASKRSVDLSIKANMDAHQPIDYTIEPGHYRVDYMDGTCNWIEGLSQYIGQRSGKAFEKSFDGSCTIWEFEYNYTQTGDRVDLVPTKERYRNNCSENFKNKELEPYSCFIVSKNESQFMCIQNIYKETKMLLRAKKISH